MPFFTVQGPRLIPTVVGNPVLTFQSSSQIGLGAPPNPLFAAVPIGAGFPTRRVLVGMYSPTSTDGPVTAVTFNGSPVLGLRNANGGSSGIQPSIGSQITWAWGDVPTGTTLDIEPTGGFTNGSGGAFCEAYTFDSTQVSNPSPTTIFQVGGGIADTIALNTQANGFIIAMLSLDFFGSSSAPSITASTETYGVADDSSIGSGVADKIQVYSKKSGSLASTPSNITFGWTGAGQSFSSMLAWN